MAMSRGSSLLHIDTLSQGKSEHQINLLDHTVSQNPTPPDPAVPEAEGSPSDPPAASSDAGGLRHALTHRSLSFRKDFSRQKYAKYGRDRYDLDEQPDGEEAAKAPQVGEEATAAQTSYLEQARARAKAVLNRKKALGRGKDETDTVVDILYENQRGAFLFGMPKYSSNSLLPTDPKSWQNAQFRTSASDIRNAQLPDPSWEWAWKNWYVDMSRDVDEEGWEYSFAFVGKTGNWFAWHGNHPWFHSFVRRRRWLRMRRRRDLNLHKTKEKAHELTADYFTIHPKTLRAPSHAQSQARSNVSLSGYGEPEFDIEKMDINTVGDLFFALRHAAIDREKIRAIRRFTEEGGDELIYLSERMPAIMGMLVFQSSRRQLLSDLINRHGQAHDEHDRLAEHHHDDGDEEKKKAHGKATRRTDLLLQAVHAADEQVKKLEYWSDIKDISDSAAAGREEGHDQPRFVNKQPAEDGVPELHNRAESDPEDDSSAPSRRNDAWFDVESKRTQSGADSDRDRYSTAAESVPETPRRQKGKVRAQDLDGVAEEAEDHSGTGVVATEAAQRPSDAVEDATGTTESDRVEHENGVLAPNGVATAAEEVPPIGAEELIQDAEDHDVNFVAPVAVNEEK